jgi:formiminotetrahydrofolate cyclodeaminase
VAPTFADRSFRDVLAAFGSASPTPGGGSACAAAAALGTSLLRMGAALANIDPQSLTRIEERLVDAMDADAAAYMCVIAAQRAPKDTEAERGLRSAAIQIALRGATDVPLSIMRLCASALYEATEVAARARRSTVGDIAVAVTLLRAAIEGARLTIDANLGALTDTGYVKTVREEFLALSERAEHAAAETERLLRVR